MNSKIEKKYNYTYLVIPTLETYKNYGKVYFGMHSTNDLNDNYICSSKILSKWCHKHPNDFYREIITLFDTREKAFNAEYDLIHPHLGKNYCLNLIEGGEGAPIGNKYHLGHIQSAETREKCRIASLGNKNASGKRTEKQRENIKNGWKKGHTEETFKKQSNSMKKYFEDPVNRKRDSEKIKALWQDPEYRKKVCSAHTRIITEEELKKRSESMKGKNKGKHKVWDNKELNKYHMEY